MTSRWFADTKTYLLMPIPSKTGGLFWPIVYMKIIPTRISSVLRPSYHIFSDYIQLYLVTSISDLKFSEAHTFEKARLIGLELRRKQGISHKMVEQLISEIPRINNNYFSKLRSKFISLCDERLLERFGQVWSCQQHFQHQSQLCRNRS